MHRLGLCETTAGCVEGQSLAEYGKVVISIQLLTSLNTCFKSKTENINLGPSFAYTFLCFLLFLAFSTVLSASLSLTKGVDLTFLTLCWAFHTLSLLIRVPMRALMAIHIILKKKLWFSELSAIMSDLIEYSQLAIQPTVTFLSTL